MQALEKIAVNTNWIPMVLVFLITIIAVLKVIDAVKLKGYVFALFNKGFIEDEVEEDTSFFSFFYSLLFVFTCTVLALVLNLLIIEKNTDIQLTFSSFLTVLSFVFGFYIFKSILEVALIRLFLVKKQVRFYVISKFSYLYSISFFLLIFFILFKYSSLNPFFLSYIISGLFVLRFIFHVRNNKNLIFRELFYFILYICALEIAPLLILFKLML